MGKLIAVMNRKGGVGKTTTTIALADTFVSEFKKNVLVVDLDPQASASIALLGEAELLARADAGRDLAGYLNDALATRTVDLDDLICTDVNIIKGRGNVSYHLIPASELLWDVEHKAIADLHLGRLKDFVKDILQKVKEQYDFVLIDSPPGKAQSAEPAVQMADLILCPTVPDQVSVWGLNSFSRYVKTMTNGQDVNARFLVTKYNENNKEHAQFYNQLSEKAVHGIPLLQDKGMSFGSGNLPMVVRQDVNVPRRLSQLKPSSFQGLYGKDSARDLIRVARAVRGELGDG